MRNIKLYRNVGIGILALLLVLVTWVAIITYTNRDLTRAGHLMLFAIENHVWIMVSLVVISVGFGFVSSTLMYSELEKQKRESKGIMKTVLLFLAKEERAIVNFLVEKKGETTQADISRLPGMNRVKAHRSLQKMQEKNIIDITAHGKVRKVKLNSNILNTFLEN